VLGAMAGRGADVAIIDDPHNEREALIGLVRPEVYDSAFDWFRSGPRQRLQPGGAIIVCMTRWSKRDLVGQIIANDTKGEWEVIEFPAILPSGNALWPEFWPIAQLEATRDELRGLRWNAQYQQQPTATDLSLVKPTDWRPWQEANFMPRDPPRCTLVVQSWDTAHSAKKHANPSACTTWGLTEWENKPAVVLLHAWQDRVEFPDLKAKAKELYKQWKPDHVIVESQASGRPLISELRTSGIPVREFRAISGVDKFTRVNAVTDLFKSGFIHYIVEPDTTAVIEQFADFPSGSADDLVDSSTAALDLLKRNIAEYRQQQNREPGEEVQDDDDFQVRRRMRRAYY
jgi:predicted phage terminase large subunit-like protein